MSLDLLLYSSSMKVVNVGQITPNFCEVFDLLFSVSILLFISVLPSHLVHRF